VSSVGDTSSHFWASTPAVFGEKESSRTEGIVHFAQKFCVSSENPAALPVSKRYRLLLWQAKVGMQA
jgi:hypothetical protein